MIVKSVDAAYTIHIIFNSKKYFKVRDWGVDEIQTFVFVKETTQSKGNTYGWSPKISYIL